MVVGTATAVAFTGPIGLLAVPVLAVSNLFRGKQNALSNATATAMGMVANISQSVGKRLSGLSYSDEVIRQASNIKLQADARESQS
ncbi:MAG UNVERIFIED_CONTAM: hypothetical protein LVQ98_06715 [Rickettsiaceae bacterium]|jgi:hypothetical protein